MIDGAHSVSYYWVGKNKAATLFSSTPAGPFGMDTMDFIGWVYEGTARSTLAAALVHFSGNLCGMLWPKTDRVAAFELAFLTLAAVVVALRGHSCGPRRTGDREERRRPSG